LSEVQQACGGIGGVKVYIKIPKDDLIGLINQVPQIVSLYKQKYLKRG